MLKKIILCLMMTVTVAACATKEEKAQKLIDGLMFETLADYDSYQAIKTTVDSLLDVPENDTALIAIGQRAWYCINESMSAYKSAQQSLDRAEYWIRTNKEMYKTAMENADCFKQRGREMENAFNACVDSVSAAIPRYSGKLVGWKFTHEYRYRTPEGKAAIVKHIYVTDLNVKTIIDDYALDDENYQIGLAFVMHLLKNKDAETAE